MDQFQMHRKLVDSLQGMDRETREYLYSALNIHGHVCGGMPMGFAAGLAAMKALGMSGRERNMNTTVVVNAGIGHAAGCFVDGVQFSTGCTFGKGLLKREPKGKWQFVMIQKKDGRAVRVRIREEILESVFTSAFMQQRQQGVDPTDVPPEISHAGFIRILSMKPEDVVHIEGPFTVEVRPPRPSFRRLVCSSCGQSIAENYARLEDGKPVCLDCTAYTA